ncbi:MAG: CRTAC1 family protein [Myxococcales bacterium]|nr:CRTAC1 family protein [Myxococcales bacterium]
MPDAVAEADAVTLAWLGVCPPSKFSLYPNKPPQFGYPVPGMDCAKPGWPSAPKTAPFKWVDITANIGADKLGIVDPCLLWQDFNGDSKPDLMVVEQPAAPGEKRYARFLLSNSSGAKWAVASTTLPASAGASDCAPIDWDDDGDIDVVLTNDLGVRVLHNNNGVFTDAPLMVPAVAKGQVTSSAVVVDIDRDGDQDIYLASTGEMSLQPGQFYCAYADAPYIQCCFGKIGTDLQCLTTVKGNPITSYTCCLGAPPGATNMLLRNDTGTMVPATDTAGVGDTHATLVVATADIDRDGWPDLFSGNDFGPLGWYRAKGDGTYAYASTALGLRPYGHFMGTVVADLNGDGLLDMTQADFGPITVYLGQKQGGWLNAGSTLGTWKDVLDCVGQAQLGADLNNDGWLDLVTTFSMTAKPGKLMTAMQVFDTTPHVAQGFHMLHRNLGGGFEAISMPWSQNMEHSLLSDAVASSDLDNDGDLDLAFVSSPGVLQVLRNDSTSESHWFSVEMQRQDSALGGIGAHVQIWAQGHVQEREVQWTPATGARGGYVRHFGLGSVKQIDKLVVWWPSGRVQVLGPLAVDQKLTLSEMNAKLP